MKSIVKISILLLSMSAATSAMWAGNKEKEISLAEVIDKGLYVSTQQSLLLAKDLEGQRDLLPRTYENGELQTTSYKGWISGFFPGVLWYLYENEPSDVLKQFAELYTERVEPAKNMTNTHDLGFMLYCSFGNAYRLTNNAAYWEVLKTGAESLSTRYDDKVTAIKSWNSNAKWQFPVIIDNMMNLEFLSFVAKKSGSKQYMDIANKHAHTTLTNHFRSDYSCYHVISYDTITGKPHFKGTHQGYADASSWARGQGWALYGFTMMYRETGKKEYLEQARNVARFIINHPNMPKDKVPYWDFNAPDIPQSPRDASAAAVIASALIELSQLDKSKDSSQWLEFAEQQIRSLTSNEYLAEIGTNGHFILKHSVGNLNKNSEVDVPLTYADYYYVEALLRLKKLMLASTASTRSYSGIADRAYWLKTMIEMIDPIYSNLSQNTLRANMPVETIDGLNTGNKRKEVTHLEALGRSLAGIAPWLSLPVDETEEGKLRSKYIQLVVKSLANAVNPESPDYMPFDRMDQSLVDAAFLAEGLLRSKDQIWPRLDNQTKQRLVKELKASRNIKAPEKNWLMFSATVEAALLEFTGECNLQPIHYALQRHKEWYKGDAWYGDGTRLHMDFYNSFVIQPMIMDVLEVMKKHQIEGANFYDTQVIRFTRYAEQLERMIGPDGTYPPIGRSITYRLGAFQVLTQAALMDKLPKSIKPAQVRCALTKAMKRQLIEKTYDKTGWLTLGMCGHQPVLAEPYVSTGSLYMCTLVFLPLGLDASNEFWSGKPEAWTALKIWNGDEDVVIDHALRD